MTCKDCIHYDVCEDSQLCEVCTIIACGGFKNKADFVEVVRCKDCIHANDDGTICRHSAGRAVEPEHFCSYGERK